MELLFMMILDIIYEENIYIDLNLFYVKDSRSQFQGISFRELGFVDEFFLEWIIFLDISQFLKFGLWFNIEYKIII